LGGEKRGERRVLKKKISTKLGRRTKSGIESGEESELGTTQMRDNIFFWEDLSPRGKINKNGVYCRFKKLRGEANLTEAKMAKPKG